jgi:TATA-box binding protein (TBP) (component of TFIID and TFIIIB)
MQIVNSTIACHTKPTIRIRLETLPGAKLYPKFPGAKVRFHGFSAMFFRSGKINVLGLRKVQNLNRTMQELTRYLSDAGYPVSVEGKVNNVVVSNKLGTSVNLEAAYALFRKNDCRCMLELELYPALRIWHGWTAMVYHTGAIILTGLADPDAAIEAMTWISHSLRNQ